MEIWKQINNYSKYEISDNGKVRNKETQKEISQRSLDKDGYPTVKLYNDNGIRKKIICSQISCRSIHSQSRKFKISKVKEWRQI